MLTCPDMRAKSLWLFLGMTTILLLAACGKSDVAPALTPTPVPEPTSTATPIPSPTATPAIPQTIAFPLLTPRPTLTPVRPSAEALVGRGIALVSRGRTESAIESFAEAIAMDSEYTEAYYRRGLAYLAIGQAERAIEDLTEAIGLDPESIDAHNSRGVANATIGQLPPAVADFNAAISLDPEHGSAYFNRAQVYILSGDLEQAVADLDRVVSMHPEVADAYGWRGLGYLQLGQAESAVEDLSRAIEIEPRVEEYYAYRALSFIALGLDEQAQRDMLAVLELGLDPDVVSTLLERGEAFEPAFALSPEAPIPPPLPSLASGATETATDFSGTWRGSTTLAGFVGLTIDRNLVLSVSIEECQGVVSHFFPYDPPRDALSGASFSLEEGQFTLNGTFSSEFEASGSVVFASVPPCGTTRHVAWSAIRLPASATGEWSEVGPLSEARASHSATLLKDGTVLLAGGRNEDSEALSTAEIYDPSSGTWSSTGSMEHSRSGHQAVLLDNGSVLAVGGSSESGEPLAAVEIYDPSAGRWPRSLGWRNPVTSSRRPEWVTVA